MTTTQFLLIIGTVCIAPHTPAFFSIPVGLLFVTVGLLFGIFAGYLT